MKKQLLLLLTMITFSVAYAQYRPQPTVKIGQDLKMAKIDSAKYFRMYSINVFVKENCHNGFIPGGGNILTCICSCNCYNVTFFFTGPLFIDLYSVTQVTTENCTSNSCFCCTAGGCTNAKSTEDQIKDAIIEHQDKWIPIEELKSKTIK